MFVKVSDRLDIFVLVLVGSLHAISSDIEIPFSGCHTTRAFGGNGGDGAGERD